MASPFDYVKNINTKSSYDSDLTGYNPFLTNRCFAMHMDTIFLADEMNIHHRLLPELQYDFYYHAVRKGKRFGFPPKPEPYDNLELIQEHYHYSRQKAIEALHILTPDQIEAIKRSIDRGGNK
jgi:hypothetical protein